MGGLVPFVWLHVALCQAAVQGPSLAGCQGIGPEGRASTGAIVPSCPLRIKLTLPPLLPSTLAHRRWVPGGHVTSFLLHHRSFRQAIVDSLAKLAQPPPLATTAAE